MSARPEDDPRWPAVRDSDPQADGRFVYAVQTTGIYCHPSCSARTPRPENVVFHPDATAAERAGFRACQRCLADQPPAATRRAQMVAALCRHIDASETAPTLAELGQRAGCSPSHVHRAFKAALGVTPNAYAAARRAARLERALGEAGTITDAIMQAGYGDASRFYATADARLGMSPTTWRAGGAGESIHVCTTPCSLGYALVAATPRGICAIALGDAPDALRAALDRRLPRATLIDGDGDFAALVERVIRRIDDPADDSPLPLDIRGTAFQQRVWQALTRIPPGETVSYGALARTLGAEGAARAVAGACAANPLAVVIPCHRVVRGDGGSGGYRWGLERKRSLLAREAAADPPTPGPRR